MVVVGSFFACPQENNVMLKPLVAELLKLKQKRPGISSVPPSDSSHLLLFILIAGDEYYVDAAVI